MTNDGLQPDAEVYDPHSDAVRLGDQGSTNIHLLALFEFGRLRCGTDRAENCNSDGALPMIGDSSQDASPMIGHSAPTSSTVGDILTDKLRPSHSRRGKLPQHIFPISFFEPVHGKASGLDYAAEFVTEFMGWMRNNDLITAWCMAELLVLADACATELGELMPRNRNFLGAVKRFPGVNAHANRHVSDVSYGYHGKTTIYNLKGTVAPAKVGPTTK